MNEIYKWLILKRLFGEKKKSLNDNSKNLEKTMNKSGCCSEIANNYYKKMEVEILGEPRIRRTCLSPRSTPIVLEINFRPKLLSEEKSLSKSLKVEWGATHDEIVTKKRFYFNNKQEENNCENLRNYENELSVAYLGRQNKRVYLEKNESIEMKILARNDDFDSTKVNLSKKSKLENTHSRHLDLGENNNNIENYGNGGYEDLVLVEEWLFEN
ncbi:unnamed protein product [Cryptosporidium hominis]|uniref:Uncharacterized protein n=2 Tax=Cryptosporidium hominis TaxID=237895 RepID=A0A0S4TF78_CRYHO|nr:hypothetical protein ChTU502y2012_295g0045 [Cryptosporidium hominis]PPA64362.1 hypothetical protein ChUKH1_04310 [Cryptosporidium hominis]PPS92651.1 Uncharacterized protein GY17_00003344 [Cryptosporidium hominis]CUV05544.1 unnamed protein product [Cryptosporidium hominis]|eukprot:PPS92651.1 Uncharacterized protein GY17_00003344 [Cryptosporidium hominis]